MRYSAVLFDLFGTLVVPFRKQEHMEAIRACADYLHLDFEDCHRHVVDSFPRRIRGGFATIGDNFAWIVQRMNRQTTSDALLKAEDIYEQFTIAGLEPLPGALDLLQWLNVQGVRVALVTNCAPDIPRIWSQSPFAKHFQHCAFSCEVGVVKPEPEIYRSALNALGVQAHEVLYVGDGSDQELTGAARCGMTAVLVSRDLSNTYDHERADVDGRGGPVIRDLSEVRGIVEGEIERR